MFRSEYIQNESCATGLVKVKSLRLLLLVSFVASVLLLHPMSEQLLK